MIKNDKPTIGIIGAGRLGTAVARQALKAKYQVKIANSKEPESLNLILSVLFPGAVAASVRDVIVTSDVIVLGIPLHQYSSLQPDLFGNKIVIDAMNYWPPTEGHIAVFENAVSSSEFVQRYLPQARVIKSLNHVAYNELEEHSLKRGASNRRAISIAGDDSRAKEMVAVFINDLGFDPVDLGGLSQGKKIQPDSKLFNARFTAEEIRQMLNIPNQNTTRKENDTHGNR